MTLTQMVALYRTLARDTVTPYFSSDADVVAFLNEAQDEAAKRARLIHDDSTTAVCQITVEDTAGVWPSTFSLHASLYELTSVRLFTPSDTTEPVDLRLVSREWLNKEVPDWRESTEDPTYAIQHDRTIRIVPGPKADGLLKLEGYRLPLAPMVPSSAENPEINAAHHRHLVQWALHRGYSVPDSEIFDATRSSLALAEFERYFGLPVDSDLRRAERIDVEHHNVAILV